MATQCHPDATHTSSALHPHTIVPSCTDSSPSSTDGERASRKRGRHGEGAAAGSPDDPMPRLPDCTNNCVNEGTDFSRIGEELATIITDRDTGGITGTALEVDRLSQSPFAATFWGDVKVYGNVYQSSDARAKEDIEDAGVKITGEEREGYIGQLATIMQLELKKYKYKKGIPGHSNDREEVGIIAQQLREVRS